MCVCVCSHFPKQPPPSWCHMASISSSSSMLSCTFKYKISPSSYSMCSSKQWTKIGKKILKQFCNIGYKNGANLRSGKCHSLGLYVQYFAQNDGTVAFMQLTDILMGLGWKFNNIVFCKFFVHISLCL